MYTKHPRLLAVTLYSIGVVQAVLGLAFLVAPEAAAKTLGLTQAPGWTNWLFGMMAARFLGFAYGMWIAARNPIAARPWIVAMIAVQAVDWVVTVKYLTLGAVTLMQVSTASFLPIFFIIALVVSIPRKSTMEP